MTVPLLLIAFIAFCIAMIIVKSKQKRGALPYKAQPVINKGNKTFEKTPTPFEIMQINSRGVQLIESLEIIATTKNLDTLRGRIDFILDFYSSLIVLSVFPRYLNEAQQAIDTYKTRYYDKIIKTSQASLLIKPNMSDLNDYFANCIVLSYGEFVKEQALSMSELVRDHAIQARKEKIIKVGYDAKQMFKTYDLPTDKGHLEGIEEMRKQFYHQIEGSL